MNKLKVGLIVLLILGILSSTLYTFHLYRNSKSVEEKAITETKNKEIDFKTAKDSRGNRIDVGIDSNGVPTGTGKKIKSSDEKEGTITDGNPTYEQDLLTNSILESPSYNVTISKKALAHNKKMEELTLKQEKLLQERKTKMSEAEVD